MSETIQISRLSAMLESFGIKHSSKVIADIIDQSETEEYSYREFLLRILETEAKGRNERRRHRNLTAAHLPPNAKPLEEFDPSELEAGISEGQIRNLKELAWLDAYSNIILAGPPGLGKSMLAVGLGLHAISEGYTVCFEKMEKFVDILTKADYDRASGFRLGNMKKAQLVIIDEIGYTPITRDQANRFFSFISDAYERTSIIFTTNKEIPQWAEMMGDPILTTAMLDRILHHSRCFSLRGKSYRLKHPELFGEMAYESETTGN